MTARSTEDILGSAVGASAQWLVPFIGTKGQVTHVLTTSFDWAWEARLMATNGGASWFRRLFSRSTAKALDPTRGDLVVVASSFEDAESCSAALERGANETGFESGGEVVFRHHLLLPSDTVADAVAVAGQDGYAIDEEPTPVPSAPANPESRGVPDGVAVTLLRVQVLDALHCSQERSRMAGLAQRRGGVVSGWDALQPGPAAAD